MPSSCLARASSSLSISNCLLRISTVCATVVTLLSPGDGTGDGKWGMGYEGWETGDGGRGQWKRGWGLGGETEWGGGAMDSPIIISSAPPRDLLNSSASALRSVSICSGVRRERVSIWGGRG